jgi:hypothetical protein
MIVAMAVKEAFNTEAERGGRSATAQVFRGVGEAFDYP